MSDLPAIKYLDMAAKAAGWIAWTAFDKPDREWTERASIIAHARTLEEADRLREALAKYEPEPVDPAREVVVAVLGAYHTTRISGSDVTGFILGKHRVQNALAQYKAERPTITDDEALLIAREICGRANPGLRLGYKMGDFDNSRELQFALAMAKRDPAALEAFRGVVK